MNKRTLDWVRVRKLVLTVSALAVQGAALGGDQVRNLVIHVYDFAHVPDNQWILAKQEAEQVYAQIGVRLVWMRGQLEFDAPARARHVDVIIMSQASADRQTGINAPTLGLTDKRNGAYIFYSRIADTVGYSLVGTGSLLGKIISHEIGHLLLTDGHSKEGIMRAHLDSDSGRPERFDDAQAAAIRAKIDSIRR